MKEVDQGAKVTNNIFLSALTDIFKVNVWAHIGMFVVAKNVLTYLKIEPKC